MSPEALAPYFTPQYLKPSAQGHIKDGPNLAGYNEQRAFSWSPHPQLSILLHSSSSTQIKHKIYCTGCVQLEETLSFALLGGVTLFRGGACSKETTRFSKERELLRKMPLVLN